MVRKTIAATVSAALCFAPVGAAFAQDAHYDAARAPVGASASINLRVPLGSTKKSDEPTYGLTFGYGQTVGMDNYGTPLTRQVRLADLRFNGEGNVRTANVASFDLANLDEDPRLNLAAADNTLWLVVGLVAVGVGVCLLADCFDGDDDEVAQ